MFLNKITKRQWTLLILTLITLAFLYFVLPVSIPLVIALLTALLLNPLVQLIQTKLKINRQFSVIIVFLIFILLIAVVGTYLITLSIGQIVHFVEDLPEYFNQLNTLYADIAERIEHYSKNLPAEFVNQITDSLEQYLLDLNELAKEKITLDRIAQIFAKVPQYLISFLVYLIALFLFMLELPTLKVKMYQAFTKETARKVTFMNKRLASVFLGFFKAQFLVSLVIFGVSLIGLLFIFPDLAFIMSIIIWIIDLIPIIGSIIILGPWALFMFLAGDTIIGTKLAILAIILLALRRIIEPKLMGQHIGLSPLATLISMFIGLKLLGLFGFILGPLLVIAFTSAKEAGIIRWKVKI
ncbi:MAG TPA: sporulation integral membrane protein YtvI [Candidatus Avamphibacillus intestinigallinarum]|nr:sporulation integral membrane protein YtvI [Candidatus Avamphibacillus intestinigallinarum]